MCCSFSQGPNSFEKKNTPWQPKTRKQQIFSITLREKLFSKGNRSTGSIPPTSDALRQHVLGATYQGGFAWSKCVEKEPQQLPSPSWGWKKGQQYWQPVWMTLCHLTMKRITCCSHDDSGEGYACSGRTQPRIE